MTITAKRCSGCLEVKAPESFNRNAAAPDGLHTKCRSCRSSARKVAYEASPEQYRERSIWANMKHKYGVTREQYEEMLRAQDGVCAICRGDQQHTTSHSGGEREIARFCLDHDHATGEVRALLCTRCNCLLGYAEDDVERLMAAAAYLLSYRTVLQEVLS